MTNNTMNYGRDSSVHNQIAEVMEENRVLLRPRREAWLSAVLSRLDLVRYVDMLFWKTNLRRTIMEMQNRLSRNYFSHSFFLSISRALVRGGGVINEIRTSPLPPDCEQLCSHCQCPILFSRRKSKVCELCNAKKRYVSSLDFGLHNE